MFQWVPTSLTVHIFDEDVDFIVYFAHVGLDREALSDCEVLSRVDFFVFWPAETPRC